MALIPRSNLSFLNTDASNQLNAQNTQRGFDALAGGISKRFDQQRQDEQLKVKAAADAEAKKGDDLFKAKMMIAKQSLEDGTFTPKQAEMLLGKDAEALGIGKSIFADPQKAIDLAENFDLAKKEGKFNDVSSLNVWVMQNTEPKDRIKGAFSKTVDAERRILESKAKLKPGEMLEKGMNTYILTKGVKISEVYRVSDKISDGQSSPEEEEWFDEIMDGFIPWKSSMVGQKAIAAAEGKHTGDLKRRLRTEDTKNLVWVDTFKSAIELAGKTEGEVNKLVESGDIVRFDEGRQEQLENLMSANEAVKNLDAAAKKIFKAENGLEAFLIQNAKLTLDQIMQTDPNVKAYFDMLPGFSTPIAKGLFKEVGAMAKEDNVRFIKMFPKETDTGTVAALKLSYIKKFVKARKRAILSPMIGFNLGDLRAEFDNALDHVGSKGNTGDDKSEPVVIKKSTWEKDANGNMVEVKL